MFRVVSANVDRTIARGPGLTIVFRHMEPFDALRAFARGELDEAPVPQGEIQAMKAHPTLSRALHVRQLLGVDAIVLPTSLPRELLRVYRLTVPRNDYRILIGGGIAPPAFGLLPGGVAPGPAGVRKARRSIPGLPRVPVRIDVVDRPGRLEAAELVWAEWRQLGLPVTLFPRHEKTPPETDVNARFIRAIATYPHPDGVYDALGLEPGTSPENVIPLGYPVAARLVSPRVRGWHMDATGLVDYSRVTLEPGS